MKGSYEGVKASPKCQAYGLFLEYWSWNKPKSCANKDNQWTSDKVIYAQSTLMNILKAGCCRHMSQKNAHDKNCMHCRLLSAKLQMGWSVHPNSCPVLKAFTMDIWVSNCIICYHLQYLERRWYQHYLQEWCPNFLQRRPDLVR